MNTGYSDGLFVIPWHKSLWFRLGLAINCMAVLLLATFWVADYRRERDAHLHEQAERLLEEAKVIRLAQEYLGDEARFQQFIDGYCRQMEPTISPGHHIFATDASDQIVSSSRAGMDDHLEHAFRWPVQDRITVVSHDGQDFMAVSEPRLSGQGRVVVAQSLAPVHRFIRRQVMTRASSMAMLVGLILVVTDVLLFRWIRRPIGKLVEGVRAIGAGHFDTRIELLQTPELTTLACGINEMAASLGHAERNRRLEMEKARRIHLGLLPASKVGIPGLAMSARYIPAESVGGDYHDALVYGDGKWLLVIADVSGHGLSAALVTAMLKGQFRSFVRQGEQRLDAIAGILNTDLHWLLGTEHFVTCFLGLYDPKSGHLDYANCGHESAVLLDTARDLTTMLESTGLPLGAVADTSWDIGEAQLDIGSRLYLVTDGLAEASGRDGRALGRDQVGVLIRETADRTLAAQIDTVLSRLAAFSVTDGFLDDVTIVAFERTD